MKNETFGVLAEELKKMFTDLKLEDDDIFNESIMSVVAMRLYSDKTKFDYISNVITKVEEELSPLWGFNKTESDAPPYECAKEGRANARGISYLYTAKDIKTAILEMRPQMNMGFNIGVIKIIKDAKIFDLTYELNNIKDGDSLFVSDLHRISEEFSKPNFGDTLEYLPTQYLCEYIRNLGFDGIKFKSSVSTDGINILFFDTNENTRVYDIIESRVYSVKSIDIDINQVLPMEVLNWENYEKLVEPIVVKKSL